MKTKLQTSWWGRQQYIIFVLSAYHDSDAAWYYDVIVRLPRRPAEIPFPACTVRVKTAKQHNNIYKSLPRIPSIANSSIKFRVYNMTNFKRIPYYYRLSSFHPGTVYILLCARIAYIFTWLGIKFYITFTGFHNRARSRHRRQSNNNMYLPINVQQ